VFCKLYDFVVFAFFLSGCVKPVSSCFLCSDDEDPKRDAATAPSAEDATANEPPVQEAEPAVKSSKAPELLLRKFR
jgi:hypothetical protein